MKNINEKTKYKKLCRGDFGDSSDESIIFKTIIVLHLALQNLNFLIRY